MLFKLNNISKHYGSESDGTLRKVLDGLSLEVEEGESIAILGPSGTGKTTLLNIMGTLDRPDSGDVFFRDNQSISKATVLGRRDEHRTVPTGSESLSTEDQDDFEDITGGREERATTRVAPTEETSQKPESKTDNASTQDKKSELRAVQVRPIVKIKHTSQKTDSHDNGQIASSQENDIGRMQFPTTLIEPFSQKENLVNYSAEELDTFRNQKIGFVFQMHHLLPQCTLLENILIPTLTIDNKKIRAERLIRARELMERVGIWEQRDQMPGHLSGGECQRAAVVRALINNPGLLLADEPTGALDEDNVSKLALLLLEINKTDGVTLVVVTHSVALAAKMDTVYELRNGKLRLKNLKA